MTPLEKRVADRMQVEARGLRAEQTKLGKQRKKLTADATKAQTAMQKWFVTLNAGDTPSKAVADAGEKALKTLASSAKAMLRLNERMAENAAALATLDSEEELARRVALAEQFGGDGESTMSGVEALEVALVKRGKATHITDLSNDVVASGVVRLTGKTPTQTLSAYMAKEVAKPEGRFVRIAPGVFDLRHRESKASKKAAEKAAEKTAEPEAVSS